MKLYLARHGIAKSKEEDPSRGLTKQGVQEVDKVASIVGNMGLNIEGIFHSDKTRAVQTATVFAHYLKPTLGIHETDELYPDDDISVWVNRILCSDDDPMIVGHLPYLNRLIAKLVVQNDSKQLIDFQPATLVCLEDGCLGEAAENFSVKWVLSPALFA